MKLTREQFAQRFSQVFAGDKAHAALHTGLLITDLLSTSADWSRQALLGMLQGARGAEVATSTWGCVLNGCSTTLPKPEDKNTKTMLIPFSSWCVYFGRLDMLEQVSRLHPPPALVDGDDISLGATTHEGQMLDRMSSAFSGDDERVRRLTFMHAVYFLESPRRSLRDCARLQVQLDPAHAGIDGMRDTELGALMTEILMAQRMSNSTPALAPEHDQADPTPTARRRHRGV